MKFGWLEIGDIILTGDFAVPLSWKFELVVSIEDAEIESYFDVTFLQVDEAGDEVYKCLIRKDSFIGYDKKIFRGGSLIVDTGRSDDIR